MAALSSRPFRVAVVGAGISGLSAAHRLKELAPHAEVSLFDLKERPGGVLNTLIQDGFEIEESADNFITTVPWGVSLCQRLGLGDDLVTTTPKHRQTFVVWRNRLHKLPDGFMMMAPTQWWPMATTRLLSPWGKLRAGLEIFVPRRDSEEDESLEAFAVRRLGREAYERLIEPLVSGVYAADMSRLSLLATLPRFREMEREYGSLIRAMRKNRQKQKSSTASVQSGPRYSLFVTVRGGLKRLTEALMEKVGREAFHGKTSVEALSPTEQGWRLVLREEEGKTRREEVFDAVILATPSHVAAQLFETAGRKAVSKPLGEIEHTGTVILNVAYRREQIGHPLDGMGAVVPAAEKSPLLALSFSNEKYPHRAPEGYTLFRVFTGGARNPEMLEKSDEEVTAILLEKIRPLVKISGEPVMTTLSRWKNTMPQYHLGHLDRVAKIETELEHCSTLGLAGNAFAGVGIPQCVHSGEQAAEKIWQAFQKNKHEPPSALFNG
ncbi:MAG: protoporphyrinogen oxidase [Planctomycetia bacterium]|nr:protoporphyrinogen oxidase [Planctomycetia bacterium]